MSEERPDVIGSLPSTRPHRRSGRRASPAPAPPPPADAAAPHEPAGGGSPQPAVKPTKPTARRPPANIRSRRPTPPAAPSPPGVEPTDAPAPTADHPGMAQTLVQAAAELTEIGLKASARALRGAVSRLPKP